MRPHRMSGHSRWQARTFPDPSHPHTTRRLIYSQKYWYDHPLTILPQQEYQGKAMRTLHLLPAAALLASAALAQTPARPTTPPNKGPTQLTPYLDTLAGQYPSQRRATIADIKTRAQAEARQREVREKILTLIGGLPEKTPLNAKVTGTTQADGFRMEKVLYESQP